MQLILLVSICKTDDIAFPWKRNFQMKCAKRIISFRITCIYNELNFFLLFFFFFFCKNINCCVFTRFKTYVRLTSRYMFFNWVKREMILFPVTGALFLRKRLICMNIYQGLMQWTLVCLYSYLFGPEPNNAQLVLLF